MKKKKAITCLRPSGGGLHFGHYIGNIEPLIKYQDDFECYFIFSDLQMINMGEEKDIIDNILTMMCQMIALGVDPCKVTFARESEIKRDKLNELIIMSDYLSNARIDRLPLFKSSNRPFKMSMYVYPLLQALDFYITDAEVAFSNIDNKAAIELINELFKRMNSLGEYKLKHIELIHGRTEILVGINGKKMSKAKGNAIFLGDSYTGIVEKINKMYTDPLKVHSDSPGHVEGNVVFMVLKSFLPDEEYQEFCVAYRAGKLSDKSVKLYLSQLLSDIAERSKNYQYNTVALKNMLIQGEQKIIYQ